jgi:hypothetical protein
MHRHLLAVASALVICSSLDAAASAPFFPGPAYDSTSGSGYQNPSLTVRSGGNTGNGVAVGSVRKMEAGSNMGNRAIRWDASGILELPNLGMMYVSDYTNTYARAVSDAGIAVGSARKYIGPGSVDVGDRAVRWNAAGTIVTELGHLGTNSSGSTNGSARAVNAGGTAVGYMRKFANNADRGERAVRWDASGTAATELGVLSTNSSGFTTGRAEAVNASGTAVGYVQHYQDNLEKGNRPVRWDANGTVATALGMLGAYDSGYASGYALAINDAGTTAGNVTKYVDNTDKGECAVRWESGSTVAVELGHLGTPGTGRTATYAADINAGGTIVGYSRKWDQLGFDRGFRAVRWEPLGTAAVELGLIGTPGNGTGESYANAVNDAGIIAGISQKYGLAGVILGQRAALWGTDNVALDLNTLLSPDDSAHWLLTIAADVSNRYWVSGTGTYDPDGAGAQPAYTRAFLMDVIREFGQAGDATRDDAVDFEDLLVLAQHYEQPGTARWDDGDFTGDGAVDFADLLTLAQHYRGAASQIDPAALSPGFASDWAMAQNLVPEPAGLLSLACTVSRRRR